MRVNPKMLESGLRFKRLTLVSAFLAAVTSPLLTGQEALATGESSGSTPPSAISYRSAEIVFESYPWNIWTMDRFGGNRRQLTFDGVNADHINEQPVWSSDGSKIAWVKDGAIWVMNWDGSGKHMLYQPSIYEGGAFGLAWSANDRRLAFTTDSRIRVLRLDSGRSVQPAPAMFGDGVDWSSSGWIAFWGAHDPGNDWGLWAMRPDGSDLHLVYDRQRGRGTPAWSPDGRRLAYWTYRRLTGFQIWVMRSDGTRIRHVTDGLDPTWLADGRTLVFEAYPGLPAFYPFDYLFRSDLHGENVQPYAHGPDALWDVDADGRPSPSGA